MFSKKENGIFKARLVIRGCEQKEELNYEDVFSPVVSISSLRLLFAIAIVKEYFMIKFDVKTAFLYEEIEEDIFMKVPERIEEPRKVCKLNKALYGLKQAPITWNKKLTAVTKQIGLEQIKTEQSIFKNNSGSLIMATYVDDGIILDNNKKEMETVIERLGEEFEIKKESEPSSFLGLEIIRDNNNIRNYTGKVLDTYGIRNAKHQDTPSEKIKEVNMEKIVKRTTNLPYREAVGSLLYLSTGTPPDITYSVNIASRSAEIPKKEDITKIKRTMKYLNGTKDMGITYTKENKLVLQAYCDPDYVGDMETQRSTSGFLIMFVGGPVAWDSRRQPIVALSSTEAEVLQGSITPEAHSRRTNREKCGSRVKR